MKKIFLLVLYILFFVNCSKKTYISNNDKIESTSLDAYLDSNNNLVKSIVNSKNDNSKIKLDGKEYNVNEFKKIIDTITGNYSFTVEKYSDKQIINITRKK